MSTDPSSGVCVRVIYRGRVQGVGFRWTAAAVSRRFAVDGTVRNLADGTVELIAQGDRRVVSDFLVEIATTMQDHIDAAEAAEISVQGDLAGFRILR